MLTPRQWLIKIALYDDVSAIFIYFFFCLPVATKNKQQAMEVVYMYLCT